MRRFRAYALIAIAVYGLTALFVAGIGAGWKALYIPFLAFAVTGVIVGLFGAIAWAADELEATRKRPADNPPPRHQESVDD